MEWCLTVNKKREKETNRERKKEILLLDFDW